MFAEDIKISATIISFREAHILQNDLDKLCNWQWSGFYLQMLTLKVWYHHLTLWISYECWRPLCKTWSCLNREGLRSVVNFQTYYFTLHCDKVSAKIMQSFGLIKRTFTHLTNESFLMFYIRPHLEYCAFLI